MNHASCAGETALTLAIKQNCNDVAKLLMSIPSCDLDAGTVNFPLHMAVFMGKESVVLELIKQGADLNKVGVL